MVKADHGGLSRRRQVKMIRANQGGLKRRRTCTKTLTMAMTLEMMTSKIILILRGHLL